MAKTKKKKEIKYVRLSENSNQTKFVEIGEKVFKNEIIFSHYAIEGNIGYFFYKILK